MKKLKRFSLVIALLFFADFSIAQMDKATCEAMFNDLNYKSYNTLSIISNMVVVGNEAEAVPYRALNAKFPPTTTFKEKYILFKTEKNRTFMIPYDKIKFISGTPGASHYSLEGPSLNIYLVD